MKRSHHKLDLEVTDLPLHGRREGRFFHGQYDELAAAHFCRRASVGRGCGPRITTRRRDRPRQCSGGCDRSTTARSAGPWPAQALYHGLDRARGELANCVQQLLRLFARRLTGEPVKANQLRLSRTGCTSVWVGTRSRLELKSTAIQRAAPRT